VANTKVVIYKQRDKYFWAMQTQRFRMSSKHSYATKGGCKRSVISFIEKHKFDYWGVDIKYRDFDEGGET